MSGFTSCVTNTQFGLKLGASPSPRAAGTQNSSKWFLCTYGFPCEAGGIGCAIHT